MADRVLALVEQPRVITGLRPQGNGIVLQSYITGRPEAIAIWHAENLHLYLVASLALVLAVPLRSVSQRVRLGSLTLVVILLVTLAICVVQVRTLVEDYARTSLGMTLYTSDERAFLYWANRALVLVGVMLLPSFLFLGSYLSSWSEASLSSRNMGLRSGHGQEPVPLRWPWGAAAAAMGVVGAAGLLAAFPRTPPPHRVYLEGLQRLVAQNPRSTKAHLALALFYEEEGRLDEAADLYRRVIDVDPNLVIPHFNLGNVFYKKTDYTQAAECYEAVLKLDPRHVSARSNLGNVYFQQGLYERAAETYGESLRLDERRASTHRNLGLTFLRLSRPCEALPHLQRSAALDSNIAADGPLRTKIATLVALCKRE